MLTLLVGVRSTLADDLEPSRRRRGFRKSAYVVSMESPACYTFLERACHDLSDHMCAKSDRLGGDSPASFWQNECAKEFLFPSRIELAQPQITRQTDLIHKTACFEGREGMIPKRHNCS